MPYLKNNSKLLEADVKDGYDLDLSHNPTFEKIIKQIDLSKWYYANKKIYYKHNEYGYRSDNLSDIKDSDYILTFGCSYSYGTGLFYEDTYSYKLSKEFGLKNINLAIPGSGIKLQELNTTLFINSFSNIRLPKYVIYQYPHDYRVSLCLSDGEKLNLETQTAGANTDGWEGDGYMNNYYLKNSGEKHLRDFVTPLYLNNIWKSLGVPVFHITFGDYNHEFKSDFQDFEILNIEDDKQHNKDEYLYLLARDLSHNGREFHDKVKETILNKIKNG